MHTTTISPESVALILEYAKNNFPGAEVIITGQKSSGAARSVYVDTHEITEEQAYKLIELRRQLKCHVAIGNGQAHESVLFDMQFPFPHPRNL